MLIRVFRLYIHVGAPALWYGSAVRYVSLYTFSLQLLPHSFSVALSSFLVTDWLEYMGLFALFWRIYCGLDEIDCHAESSLVDRGN